METTTIAPSSSSHGDDILNWQFNLLMISHGSISILPHGVGWKKKDESEMGDSEIGSFIRNLIYKLLMIHDGQLLSTLEPLKFEQFRHDDDKILITNFSCPFHACRIANCVLQTIHGETEAA